MEEVEAEAGIVRIRIKRGTPTTVLIMGRRSIVGSRNPRSSRLKGKS